MKKDPRKKLWNHLFPARGCVHVQHTVLCTWEASSLTLGCTWMVVNSPAHALSHTDNGSGLRGTGNFSPVITTALLGTNFWVDEHSLLCCDTHLHVNTTRATVPALVRQKRKLFFFFVLTVFFFQADKKVWLWDYWLHIELEFCDISVQTWSLTSGKRRGGVTLTRNQISPPLSHLTHALY